jgi:hypothetical protein
MTSCWLIENSPNWVWEVTKIPKPKIKVKKQVMIYANIYSNGIIRPFDDLDNAIAHQSSKTCQTVQGVFNYEIEE